jgi:lipoprotein LpqH
VKRELLIAVATATIVTGAAGCSSGNNTSGPSSSAASSSATTNSSAAAPSSPTSVAPGSAKVTVDGQPLNVSGPVVCSTTAGKFSIAIGEVITGVIVGLEPDGSVVHGVGLGTVNGVVLNFTEGVPGNNASATKSGNSYSVTGTASGIDNAGQQVSKPFTIDVTCP